MEKTEQIIDLAKAIVKAQAVIQFATKDATNPYFKSNYADLTAVIDAVKKPLNDNGIAFLQAVNMDTDKPVVETILLHETGQYISSKTPVFCTKPNDPQALGSGITYSKRYALQAILGLPTEDDDGNAASKPDKKTETKALTPEELAIIDEIFKRLVDIASEKNLVPDRASIKNFALTRTQSKRLPVDEKEITKFVDCIVNSNGKNLLSQVCKPKPK